MTNPLKIAKSRNDMTQEEVLDAVQKKKKDLINDERKYKNKHPITNTVVVQQQEYPEKLLVVDEIKVHDEKNQFAFEYRFAYWVVSDNKLEKGQISVVFGQFATLIPPSDLGKLLDKCAKEDWVGASPFNF